MGKKLLFTVLLAGVLYVASGTVSAAPPTGYWPFDGNLSDIAGTAGGTFVGGQPSYQRGQIGQAISFDGVDDYVDIPSPTNPALYTISAWVKPLRTSDAGVVTRTDASGPVTSWSHQLRIARAVSFIITYGWARAARARDHGHRPQHVVPRRDRGPEQRPDASLCQRERGRHVRRHRRHAVGHGHPDRRRLQFRPRHGVVPGPGG